MRKGRGGAEAAGAVLRARGGAEAAKREPSRAGGCTLHPGLPPDGSGSRGSRSPWTLPLAFTGHGDAGSCKNDLLRDVAVILIFQSCSNP